MLSALHSVSLTAGGYHPERPRSDVALRDPSQESPLQALLVQRSIAAILDSACSPFDLPRSGFPVAQFQQARLLCESIIRSQFQPCRKQYKTGKVILALNAYHMKHYQERSRKDRIMAKRINPNRKNFLMMSRTHSGLRFYPCKQIFKKFEGKRIDVYFTEDGGVIHEYRNNEGMPRIRGVTFGIQDPPSRHEYRTQFGSRRNIFGIWHLPKEFGQVEVKWYWVGDEVHFEYPKRYPEPITFIKKDSKLRVENRRLTEAAERWNLTRRQTETGPIPDSIDLSESESEPVATTNTMALSKTLNSLFDALDPKVGPHDHLKHAMEVVNSYADDPNMFPEIVFQVEIYNSSGEVVDVIKVERPFRLVALRQKIKYENL